MCPSQANPYVPHLYEDSYRLSECILNAYCDEAGFANLGIQYYDNMSGINWSQVPVTILEMGFMTNESDDYAMQDPQSSSLWLSESPTASTNTWIISSERHRRRKEVLPHLWEEDFLDGFVGWRNARPAAESCEAAKSLRRRQSAACRSEKSGKQESLRKRRSAACRSEK